MERQRKHTNDLNIPHVFRVSVQQNAFIVSFTFNDISNPDSTASNDRTIVNNKMERMWKEAAVAHFTYHPRVCL
jgi:hypothetical protein